MGRATMPNTTGPILAASELSEYLHVKLSEYLHVNKTTIYRALREGKLPGFRVGTQWRFHVDAIEQWLREQMKDNTRKPD
jgi:excisionase family DNA binding protein